MGISTNGMQARMFRQVSKSQTSQTALLNESQNLCAMLCFFSPEECGELLGNREGVSNFIRWCSGAAAGTSSSGSGSTGAAVSFSGFFFDLRGGRGSAKIELKMKSKIE